MVYMGICVLQTRTRGPAGGSGSGKRATKEPEAEKIEA